MPSLLTVKMRNSEPASLGKPHLLKPSANPGTWGRGREGIRDLAEGDRGGKAASMGRGFWCPGNPSHKYAPLWAL